MRGKEQIEYSILASLVGLFQSPDCDKEADNAEKVYRVDGNPNSRPIEGAIIADSAHWISRPEALLLETLVLTGLGTVTVFKSLRGIFCGSKS